MVTDETPTTGDVVVVDFETTDYVPENPQTTGTRVKHMEIPE